MDDKWMVKFISYLLGIFIVSDHHLNIIQSNLMCRDISRNVNYVS